MLIFMGINNHVKDAKYPLKNHHMLLYDNIHFPLGSELLQSD